MERDASVQQSVALAKLALRANVASIDYMQPVKDNPIKSISTAFLAGAAMGNSSGNNKVPSGLFAMIVKAAEQFL
ncbi:hypothetical protein LCGC14_1489930 [marine sediment metagenome]|uniref:Uncharacterized protein n=1 Tax=marine sediment metagenome TaxID=412755 RepID=A0A0F9J7P1_9ZZZZ|nr:hypothetical protein [Methylophaga sp.]